MYSSPTLRVPLRSLLVVCVLCSALWCPAMAVAQEDASFAGFQLDRSLPGARSLALGGAFVALADDATAAYANPAGLGLLEQPEISLEYRHWRSETLYTHRGRIGFAEPDGLFETATAEGRSDAVSFFSFVWAAPERPWAIGLYRHQWADFQAAFDSQGVRNSGAPPLFGPYRFRTDFQVVNSGVSASWSFGGRFRVGAGLSHYQLSLTSRQQIFADPPPDMDSDFSGTPVARAGKEGDDDGWGANLGLLVELGPRLTFGAALRQGPDLSMREFFIGFYDVESELRLPHQLALGLAWRPTDRLTLSFEYDSVSYSRMLEANRLSLDFGGRAELDDADELRLGLEVDIPLGRGRLLTLAAGGWLDPDHTIVFRAREPISASGSTRFRRAFFRDTGEDTIHTSFGIGLTTGRLQMHVAADFSDRIDTTSLSVVYWF